MYSESFIPMDGDGEYDLNDDDQCYDNYNGAGSDYDNQSSDNDVPIPHSASSFVSQLTTDSSIHHWNLVCSRRNRQIYCTEWLLQMSYTTQIQICSLDPRSADYQKLGQKDILAVPCVIKLLSTSLSNIS
jgi:hypothetical protein